MHQYIVDILSYFQSFFIIFLYLFTFKYTLLLQRKSNIEKHGPNVNTFLFPDPVKMNVQFVCHLVGIHNTVLRSLNLLMVFRKVAMYIDTTRHNCLLFIRDQAWGHACDQSYESYPYSSRTNFSGSISNQRFHDHHGNPN